MKMWLSPYGLINKESGTTRLGFLLKMQTPDFEEGYSDISPWEEFGDPSLKNIPTLLKSGNWVNHKLLLKSVEMASRDGRARREKKSLLESKVLKNHFLISSLNEKSLEQTLTAQDMGFTHVKIKIMKNPAMELEFFERMKGCSLNFRLDANAGGTLSFYDSLSAIDLKIEYVEDPFKEPKLWENFKFPMAYDHPPFSENKALWDYRIIKPAVETFKPMKNPFVFTSYLDHPVGMAHAFFEAFEAGPQVTPYGLMSHQVYKESLFSSKLITKGCELSFEPDIGIGFSNELKAQAWGESL